MAAQVDHLQTGDQARWTSWEPTDVVAFLTDRIAGRPAPSGPTGAGATSRASHTSAPVAGAVTRRRAPRSAELHAYAIVPDGGPPCQRRGPQQAHVSIAPQHVSAPEGSHLSARVRLFARGVPNRDAEIGHADVPLDPVQGLELDVSCLIPVDAVDPRVFAVVELRSDLARTAPVGELAGVRLALADAV